MAIPEEHWQIDTPENVIFDYEVAGIGSRFLAAAVDTLLITFLQALVYLPLYLIFLPVFGGEEAQAATPVPWLVALFALVAFISLWSYYIFFEMIWNGQSPGKRWAGLRVIRTDGTPITLTESIVRNLVRMIDFLPAYYGVGVVTMFIDAQARRLGDLAAGTLVVLEHGSVSLDSLAARPFLPRAATAPSLQISWPVERLAAQDVQVAEEYISRRFELAGRAMIAQRIARALLERMEMPADPTFRVMTAEDLIVAVLAARRKLEP